MPGCGYICPKCNDTGFDDNQIACDWCVVENRISEAIDSLNISDETWEKSVHEGPCCGDLGIKTEDSKTINY